LALHKSAKPNNSWGTPAESFLTLDKLAGRLLAYPGPCPQQGLGEPVSRRQGRVRID